MWDPTLGEQLEPLMMSALDGMQKRLPSELWYAIDDLKVIFYSYAECDTAALIELHKKRLKENQTQVYPHGNDLGRLQILTGQFEEGKENLVKYYATPDDLGTAYVYVSSRYYLGIAEEGLGNTLKAKEYYEEVLKYWGNSDILVPFVKDCRARLNALSG
jgi:tetratricopeptide (TPR) repeat protein